MKEENKKTRKVKNIKRTSVVVIGTCKFDKRLLHFCLKPQTLLENLKKSSYPRRDGKRVVVWATERRPSVADCGGGMPASCTAGPISASTGCGTGIISSCESAAILEIVKCCCSSV